MSFEKLHDGIAPGRGALLKQVKEYAAKTLRSFPQDLRLVKRGVAQTHYDQLIKATETIGVNRKRFHVPGTTYYVSSYRIEGSRFIRVDLSDGDASDVFFYIPKFIRS